MTNTETSDRAKPGRKPEREKARILKAFLDDLALCEADPSLSLSYEAIQTRTGVSRRHLSNTADDDFAAIVAKIKTLELKRAGLDDDGTARRATGDSPFADASISDAALAGRAEDRVEEQARLMREWLSRHGGTPSAVMAALALHDLDMLLSHLYREAMGLRPLVREIGRRQDVAHAAAREAAGLGAGHSLDPQLTLDPVNQAP